MKLEITGNETADQLVKQLVYLRHEARSTIFRRRRCDEQIEQYSEERDKSSPGSLEWDLANRVVQYLQENELLLRTHEIEIGRYLTFLCDEVDKKVPRQLVFEAINTGKADRDTEEVRKYGEKSHRLICVLDLENSATTDEGIEIRPLKWCHTMAFMNALQTNSKLDKAIHEVANEFFDGAFGEHQERPLMERLAGRSV